MTHPNSGFSAKYPVTDLQEFSAKYSITYHGNFLLSVPHLTCPRTSDDANYPCQTTLGGWYWLEQRWKTQILNSLRNLSPDEGPGKTQKATTQPHGFLLSTMNLHSESRNFLQKCSQSYLLRNFLLSTPNRYRYNLKVTTKTKYKQ